MPKKHDFDAAWKSILDLYILKQYKKGLSVEYIADINDFDVEYVKNVVANS